MPDSHIRAAVAELALVDHHAHSVMQRDLSPAEFELMLTESSLPAPTGATHFDSQVGFALRKHCAPLLDIPEHAPIEEYLARRSELGHAETSRRLLRCAGVSDSLIDTGVVGGVNSLAPIPEFAELAQQRVSEIVRLETVAETLLSQGYPDAGFPEAFRAAVEEATATASGFKSIIAYRHGFDFNPVRPDDAEVVTALGRLDDHERGRLDDPTILRFLLWTGADTGLPLQLHAGYGDADLDLDHVNPALLAPWLRILPGDSSPVMLLHCYPYQREAGYLAQVFPRVYFDLGLGINYSGAASTALIREGLELAPFGKQLYSSDAWGVPELHLLGARLWRDGLGRALQEFVDRGEWAVSDALRVARMLCSDNARRVYQLD